ncbi:hypothetical protein IWW56_005542 [Coemansia sp. RSA 2131]|nr:hypothetical protein IWW56_005542 [Coemansia sp. RSA 2131]
MEAPGTFVRKHSVQGAKWKPAYLLRLHEYVANVNYLTSHAYAFARFILLHEVDIEDSIIFQQFGTSFFYDVFLSCAEREDEQEAGVEAQIRRAVILSYREEYKRLSGLTLRKYQPLSQVGSYVSKSILTDYKNNVMLRFGETWRRAINLKLDSKNKMDKLVKHLKSEGKSVEEIQEQRQAQIWSPAHHVKQVLCSRRPVATTAEEQTIIDFVTPVLKCYPVGHEFKGDNIYWDSKTRPEKHIKSFIMLNRCLVAANYRCIQALPLRRSWVYAHVPINTVILANHIFKEYRPVMDKKLATSPDEPAVSPDEPAALPKEPAVPAEQAQQEQLPVQRAQLAYQLVQPVQPVPPVPPMYQPLYQPLYQLLMQQEQQPWIRAVQQAYQAWQAQQAWLLAEQVWQECLFVEQAWHVLQVWLSTQPVQPVQQAQQVRLLAQQLPEQQE